MAQLLKTFYSELFGWDIDHQGEGDMQYGFIKDGSAGAIGGGVRHEPNGKGRSRLLCGGG